MPDHPFVQTDTGATWARAMRSGDFVRAWDISDAVLAARDPTGTDDARLPYHERWVWTGTPPDGLDVLVRCYHGLGDTIQFARFLPALRARAARVTLEVQPELVSLFEERAGVDRLVAFDPADPMPRAVCTIEIMELGHVLRVNAVEVASKCPYLRATAAAPSWATGSVGLCWKAGGWDPDRSLPLADLLARVNLPERYVSLQRGAASRDAGGDMFDNPRDDNMSVDRTAALITACRCVTTVDTMVAHLAGALGVQGTVLLKPVPDWRWAERDGYSLWYPTLRLANLS